MTNIHLKFIDAHHDYKIDRQTEGEGSLHGRRRCESHGANATHASNEYERRRPYDFSHEHGEGSLLHFPWVNCSTHR